MVVVEPLICYNKDASYDLCTQALKDIYHLRYEILFAKEKQIDINNTINRLKSWVNADITSKKWRDIAKLSDLSAKMEKLRDDLENNLKLSGKLRYADAKYILTRPEVYKELQRKDPNLDINEFAARISFDGPKDLFPESKSPSVKYTPKDIEKMQQQSLKKRQGLFNRVFRLPSKKVTEDVFSLPPKLPPSSAFGALLGTLEKDVWLVPDIPKERLVQSMVYGFYLLNPTATKEDAKKFIEIIFEESPEQLKEQLEGVDYSKVSLSKIIENMKEISTSFKLNESSKRTEILDSIRKQINSKRTSDKQIYLENFANSPNNQGDILDYIKFVPSEKPKKERLAREVVEYLVSTTKDLIVKQDKQGQLLIGLVKELTPEHVEFRESKLLKKNPEILFANSFLEGFTNKSRQIRELNRDYNMELEYIHESKISTKLAADTLQRAMKHQEETFKFLQKRNIDELSKIVLKDLPLWKRIFHPETVANLVEYTNCVSEYLSLVNTILGVDPNESDPEILSMFFNDYNKFSKADYVKRSKEKINRYIGALEEYRKQWEIYETNVEKALVSLSSKNETNAFIGEAEIMIQLIGGRPAINLGLSDITKAASEETKKEIEVAIDAIKKADEEIEKTKEKYRDKPMPVAEQEKIRKLEMAATELRNRYKGVRTYNNCDALSTKNYNEILNRGREMGIQEITKKMNENLEASLNRLSLKIKGDPQKSIYKVLADILEDGNLETFMERIAPLTANENVTRNKNLLVGLMSLPKEQGGYNTTIGVLDKSGRIGIFDENGNFKETPDIKYSEYIVYDDTPQPPVYYATSSSEGRQKFGRRRSIRRHKYQRTSQRHARSKKKIQRRLRRRSKTKGTQN